MVAGVSVGGRGWGRSPAAVMGGLCVGDIPGQSPGLRSVRWRGVHTPVFRTFYPRLRHRHYGLFCG